MNPRRIVLMGAVWACLVLGGAVARAGEASVAASIGKLTSPDEAVRLQAIDQLGARGGKAAEAVAPLTKLLQDSSPKVRAHAARALGEIGAPARPAVAALIKLAKDPDDTVRRQVVKAVMAIHPGPQVTVPLCVKLLEDLDPGVRIRILHAIAETGAKAVPALIVALKNFMSKEWRRASAQRRGGGRTPVQLDTAVAESRYAVDSSSLPADEAFDQQWALTLLDLTVNRLRDEFAAAGRPGDFEILKSCLMVDRGAIDYAAVVVHLPAVDRPELRSPLPLGTTRIERVTFNGLTAARIKELRFQIRPCQWVEVRNISLEPGRRTQVEVVNALGHPQ